MYMLCASWLVAGLCVFSLVHPGVVLGVGIGLFASCQLLHVLYIWAVGSGSFVILLYSCVQGVYI